MLPLLGLAQTNSKVEKPIGELLSNEISPNEMKRNASFNLDEIKVRWKKAALENCTGVPCTPFTCGTSTISDLDGNSYNTVLIGTQCWTKENLKVTRYNDGSAIPLDASGGPNGNAVGETWSTQIAGAYTIYGNEPSTGPNATNYGFLYNGYAATDARKICPSGWHVPTDGEWTKLIQFIDLSASAGGFGYQSNTAGSKLKSTGTGLWGPPNSDADNSTNFSALPGGERNGFAGSFSLRRSLSIFWSSSSGLFPGSVWTRQFNQNDGKVEIQNGYLKSGYSFRCLKD
jgi:uncharacterized protein (TIGR02145 family)